MYGCTARPEPAPAWLLLPLAWGSALDPRPFSVSCRPHPQLGHVGLETEGLVPKTATLCVPGVSLSARRVTDSACSAHRLLGGCISFIMSPTNLYSRPSG